MKITPQTKVEYLISKGASTDGKIIQQILLITQGLEIPSTYFFTEQDIINDIQGFLTEVIDDKDAQYQIRTETPDEMNRSTDYFSESRLGLAHDQLEENLMSVCKNNTIGLVQKLPQNSLDRNLISGLACVTKENKIHIDFLHGIATYLARAGMCDGSVICPVSDVKDIEKWITFKTEKEQLENFILTIMRYGIQALKKDYKLPFNKDRDRIKKEYELNPEELAEPFSMKEDIQLPENVKNRFEANCNINFKDNTFKTALVIAGLRKILDSDDQDTAKRFLSKERVGLGAFQLIAENILKVGDDLLENHLVSFSVIESNGEQKLIIWDLPVDKKIEKSTNNETNITWIESPDDFNIGKNIGINLPITSDTPEQVLRICERIKKETSKKTIYIKYSILSHLATLMREEGFEVIKYT